MSQSAPLTVPQQEEKTKIVRQILPAHDDGFLAALMDTARFDQINRAAKTFSDSTLVPEHYRGKVANCILAVALAHQMRINPLMFMLKTYPVGGKIALEAQLAIALANNRGPFRGPIMYDLTGKGDDRGCVAWAIHDQTGERVESVRVTVQTAKDEGWFGRNDKWKKPGAMQDLMLHYRSGSWLARVYCPEVLLGMSTMDEEVDTGRAVQVGQDSYRVIEEGEALPELPTGRTKVTRSAGQQDAAPSTQESQQESRTGNGGDATKQEEQPKPSGRGGRGKNQSQEKDKQEQAPPQQSKPADQFNAEEPLHLGREHGQECVDAAIKYLTAHEPESGTMPKTVHGLLSFCARSVTKQEFGWEPDLRDKELMAIRDALLEAVKTGNSLR